jgi:hypothetical protein
MKRLLFNVVSVLILSICVLSCSKKDDDDVIPITKEEIIAEWTISESPVISVILKGDDDKQKKVNDTLKYLFQKDDKYSFKGSSCEVTRGNSIAPYPTTYKVEGGYLILDGYIKFQTNVSDGKLILTSGVDEIRGIVEKELIKHGYAEEVRTSILKFVSGTLKLVLTK